MAKIDKIILFSTFLMLLVKKIVFFCLYNQKKFLPLQPKILIINI